MAASDPEYKVARVAEHLNRVALGKSADRVLGGQYEVFDRLLIFARLFEMQRYFRGRIEIVVLEIPEIFTQGLVQHGPARIRKPGICRLPVKSMPEFIVWGLGAVSSRLNPGRPNEQTLRGKIVA